MSRKPVRMGELRGWAKLAAEARQQADRLPFGQRESGLLEVAKGLGEAKWSTQTLRRALAALAVTERLEAEAGIAAASLQAFPLAAVEYAARLYRRDPEKAKTEIGRLIKGEITVAQLKRLNEELRPLDREIGTGLKARFRKSMADVIVAAVEKKLGDRLYANRRTSEIRQGLREHVEDPLAIPDFVSGDQDPKTTIPPYGEFDPVRLAVLIVGPYSDVTLYQTRSFDWAARAKALLIVYRRVILVLPENCDPQPFMYWRAVLRALDRELMLLRISADRRAEFLEDPFSGRR
jgi:hypothetical protein